MTIAEAAQTALEKMLYTESIHMRDAHSGELNQSCNTCMAFSDAIEAARIVAAEATALPKRAAQRRPRTARRG